MGTDWMRPLTITAKIQFIESQRMLVGDPLAVPARERDAERNATLIHFGSRAINSQTKLEKALIYRQGSFGGVFPIHRQALSERARLGVRQIESSLV